MTIHAYVIMHDHIHLIAKADDLGKEISRFKSYTARRIIDQLILDDRKDLLQIFEKAKPIYKKDSEFKVWQEGTHPQIILSESVMKQKIEYIHQNPVKVGYVEESINWQFSSAVNYSGLIGILDIDINW